MKVCRVLGTVVCTIKHAGFVGRALLWVRPETSAGTLCGRGFVAADAAQAGVGDRVLVLREGRGARQLLQAPEAPVRSVVVAVVDAVDTVPTGP